MEITQDEIQELMNRTGIKDPDKIIEMLKSELNDADDEYPSTKENTSLLGIFKDIIHLKDKNYNEISKTGNLKDPEIGRVKLPIRSYLSIANFAESMGLNLLAQNLRNESNVIVNTSLSRKAKLLDTLITTKKVNRSMGSPETTVKKGLFGSTEVKTTGVDE
jgi:hypothetical protein